MRTYMSFYDCLKLVCGCKFSGITLVCSQDGQTLRASYKEILNQWHEHFTSLLKCPSGISDEALNEVLQPTYPRAAGSKIAQTLVSIL